MSILYWMSSKVYLYGIGLKINFVKSRNKRYHIPNNQVKYSGIMLSQL